MRQKAFLQEVFTLALVRPRASNDLSWLTQTRGFFYFFFVNLQYFFFFTEKNWVLGRSPVVWGRTPAWASRKSISPCFQFDGLQTAGWFSKIKQASRSHPVKPFTRWPADLSIFSIRATQGEYKYPDSGKFIEVNDVRHWCSGEDCGFDSSRKWPGTLTKCFHNFSSWEILCLVVLFLQTNSSRIYPTWVSEVLLQSCRMHVRWAPFVFL